MSISQKQPKRVHRVVLKFPQGLTRSVFIRARGRQEAERKALRNYPEANDIDRSPNPQN